MAQTLHTRSQGKNRDLQNIGPVRAEMGAGPEAQEERAEGNMVETRVRGSDQEAGCGERGAGRMGWRTRRVFKHS